MDVLSDAAHAYINMGTGELIRKTQEVLNSDEYIALPDKFEIHEYAIMERFCYSIEDKQRSDELLSQIQGRGAFGRFKDVVHRHGIAEDWYRFRHEALEEIAVDWLKANSISFTRERVRQD